MKKKRGNKLVGTCPHCGGALQISEELLDRVAEASLDAVERVMNTRE